EQSRNPSAPVSACTSQYLHAGEPPHKKADVRARSRSGTSRWLANRKRKRLFGGIAGPFPCPAAASPRLENRSRTIYLPSSIANSRALRNQPVRRLGPSASRSLGRYSRLPEQSCSTG